LRIGHNRQIAQWIPVDNQEVSIGAGRNYSKASTLVEQVSIDACGGTNDIRRLVKFTYHFKLSELRLLFVRTPPVGPERVRHSVALRPSVDLLSFGDSLPEILNYALRQAGFGCGLDTLNQRDKGQVEVSPTLSHHCDCLLADEIGMFDGTNTRKQTTPYPLVGIDVRHDVGGTALRLFHDRA